MSNHDWHSIDDEELYKILETSPQGLSSKEVEIRHSKYGANKLEEPEKRQHSSDSYLNTTIRWLLSSC